MGSQCRPAFPPRARRSPSPYPSPQPSIHSSPSSASSSSSSSSTNTETLTDVKAGKCWNCMSKLVVVGDRGPGGGVTCIECWEPQPQPQPQEGDSGHGGKGIEEREGRE
ncbi:hypothetical protein K504DRAFT_501187 [Pleomassaria siparia CBS 279.74]|uniref:Uncharacterized protein n=1 Tax=Pleomassaria siparia CBS 279.74 TaxID=1314801 RepID=A0A6G1KB72_9PLEO|nr:hypothetical protein K504DRAFT_501187 [Pleomassaria siparia CBS 279.74]